MSQFHRRVLCKNWFKERADSLNANPGTGSQPTQYATISGFDNPKFRVKSMWSPTANANPKLDSFITANVNDLNKPKYHELRYRKPNLTKSQKEAISTLRNNDDIIIKPADKGSAVVILNKDDYINEGLRQLGDRKFYVETDENLTESHAQIIEDYVNNLVTSKELSPKAAEYLTTQNSRTPEFYMLPKIHKGKNPPTGRPIISGNGSPTERISQLVDHFLQPLIPKIKSYIKDTTHFLQILKDLGTIPEDSILVTLDVSSLYTNIPTVEGLRAAAKLLAKHRNGGTEPRNHNLIRMMKYVITLNNFRFNGKDYLQIGGTAMGTKCAPGYANCFMGDWEEKHVYTYPLQPLLWKRFIDDIFMIWTHGEDELEKFYEHLNSCHETIKFTMEKSRTEIAFLDTKVRLNKGELSTELYTKPTDSHNYLRYNSSHPKHVMKAIPYSQLTRIKRICTDQEDFVKYGKRLCHHFLRHGYPHDVVHSAMVKAGNLNRMDLLKPKCKAATAEAFICITRYHPTCSPIAEILKNNWEILARNKSTAWIFDSGYKIAYRRPKNLRDLLVRARIKTDDEVSEQEPIRFGNCNNPRCRYCPKIVRHGRITNTAGKKYFWTYTNVNCNSNNLVYCLECKVCRIKYVGQTKNTIKQRFQQHFYLISKKSQAHYVSKHFNGADHNGIQDVSIYVLGFIHDTPGTEKARSRRLEIEGLWQNRLNTLRPHGLNTMDET